ncbi:hypothetical protein F4778DRAFT_729703 [Xylariomycetidae sp. FL2044]|nr:hypothetical protein F4778DRAFT_729703 [Xylariomycetidae sp. FL2044]
MASKLCLSLLALSATLRQVICQQLSPAPSPDTFVRRMGHTIAVVGDYLYIDGGEISQTVDGELYTINGSHWSWQVNHTLSIPLREAWTNKSVTPKIINKEAPTLNKAALWPYDDSIYMWGGQGPYGNVPATKDLWQFRTDGQGGGSWDIINPSNTDLFFQFVRSTAAVKSICNNVGLYMGGYISAATDRIDDLTLQSRIPVPGILTYDVEARKWANESATDYNMFGTSLNAGGTCLSTLGENGLFVVIGGNFADAVVFEDNGRSMMDMATVRFYDVAANKWYSQPTTGDPPRLTDRMCIAHAQSQNATTEIFMYGGHSERTPTDSPRNETWILTLPAFHWIKTDAVAPRRSDHDCVIVGSQMISVGGVRTLANFSEPDEWSQGIGVLDLNTLTWTDSYDPDSGTYDSPAIVKKWYEENDLNDVEWSSNEVKALMLPSNSGNNDTTSPNESEKANPDSSQSSNVGAIVGGTLGGLAASALLGTAYFCLLRRKRAGGRHGASEVAGSEKLTPHGRAEADDAANSGAGATALYALPPGHPTAVPVELDAKSGPYPNPMVYGSAGSSSGDDTRTYASARSDPYAGSSGPLLPPPNILGGRTATPGSGDGMYGDSSNYWHPDGAPPTTGSPSVYKNPHFTTIEGTWGPGGDGYASPRGVGIGTGTWEAGGTNTTDQVFSSPYDHHHPHSVIDGNNNNHTMGNGGSEYPYSPGGGGGGGSDGYPSSPGASSMGVVWEAVARRSRLYHHYNYNNPANDGSESHHEGDNNYDDDYDDDERGGRRR